MKTRVNRYVLIFSGYNPRAVYSFLRTLDYNKTNYAIIAKSSDDDILLTKYKEHVLYIRNTEMLDYNDIINGILLVKDITGADEFLIAPSTEGLNRFLLQYRMEIEKLRCIIPLVDRETYELISDKQKFTRLCSSNGILVPDELEFSINSIPVVAKPLQYYSKFSGKVLYPVIIKSAEDFYAFKQRYNLMDFYYQKYISGKSIYLLYYFSKDGKIFRLSQKNLVQQPGGKSIIAAVKANYHKKDISKYYENLFMKIGYKGFVMVEVRLCNDQYYMIEANPRFWGPSQLFVDVGYNFFEAFLYDYDFLKETPILLENNIPSKYMWYGGFVNTVKRGLLADFFDIEEQIFIKELPEWIEHDVYNRSDTRRIFIQECKL